MGGVISLASHSWPTAGLATSPNKKHPSQSQDVSRTNYRRLILKTAPPLRRALLQFQQLLPFLIHKVLRVLQNMLITRLEQMLEAPLLLHPIGHRRGIHQLLWMRTQFYVRGFRLSCFPGLWHDHWPDDLFRLDFPRMAERLAVKSRAPTLFSSSSRA